MGVTAWVDLVRPWAWPSILVGGYGKSPGQRGLPGSTSRTSVSFLSLVRR
jgi:hypothetical protein